MSAERMSLVPLQANRPTWIEVLDRGGELAEVIANTDFVPRGLRGNQPAILAAILYGHEVGLEPMQSLAKIAVIDGRPTLASEAQRALILRAGHELWVEESTNTRAVVAGRRRDGKQTTRVVWTLDDAKRARLAGKPAWQAYPRQMLVARASAELARQLFADVIGGMPATEELDDAVDVDAVEAEAAEQQTATRSRVRRRQPAAVPPEPPVAEATGPTDPEPGPEDGEPEPAPPDPPNDAQLRMMFALFGAKGPTDRDERLAFCNEVVGRTIGSSTELSSLDVSRVIEALEAKESPPADKPDAGGDAPPADEQALVDEARREFDGHDVPLPGEGGAS